MQEFFIDWYSELCRDLRAGVFEHSALESHFWKYRSLMPALALVFELIDGAALAFEGFEGSTPNSAPKIEPAAPENPETHDSALVLETDAWKLILELHGVGCRFMTVEGRPRLYYPPDMGAGIVGRVAALIAGRDEASKTFRRLVREEDA